MANKTLKTRIQLKYDTYANWTATNPIPLAGEVCVVVVPASANAASQEPTILFKVGDGTTAFNSLPFVGAVNPETAAVTVNTTDWSANDNTDYPYAYNIAITDLTVDDMATVTVSPSSLNTATECGLCPTCETSDGYLTLFAVSAPTTDIEVECFICKGRVGE